MKWVLVFYIAGGVMSYYGTHPVETVDECVAATAGKLAEFKQKFPDAAVTTFSALCLQETRI
jgi:hypothetical protein